MATYPTHLFAGSNSERQSVGLPGHCERCAEFGHVRAHPSLGCGDVGCTKAHGPDNPTSTGDPVADLYAAETLIREQHGIGASRWRFWAGIADEFNRAASRGGPHHRSPGGWHEWNSLVDAARDYLNGGGMTSG